MIIVHKGREMEEEGGRSYGWEGPIRLTFDRAVDRGALNHY